VTIYAWIESKRLLAWRATRRGVLIPAEQIVGTGEVEKSPGCTFMCSVLTGRLSSGLSQPFLWRTPIQIGGGMSERYLV
jgi:hypothetical protein